MPDLQLLLRATLRIYQSAFLEAARGFICNWRLLFLQLAYLLVCALATPIAMGFGPLLGGFAMGIVLTLVVSSYLTGVAAGVEKERLYFVEVWPRTVQLFMPVIGVLFVFFLFDLVFGMLLQQGFLRAVVGVLFAVLFNVLPEVIYQRPSSSLQLFADSFEFMRENFVEWVLPAVVLALPLLFVSKALLLSLGLLVSTINPLQLLELFFMLFHRPGNWISLAPVLFIGLPVVYYIFLFRGILYRELASSTRRKRIYQERMN